MEQQRLEKTAQQQDETEEIQHGPLPIEQLQVMGSSKFLSFFVISTTHYIYFSF